MNKAYDFIQKVGWDFKNATESQCVIKCCPLCGNDKWKFYMNREEGPDNGLWDCKICGESGNLYQLQAKLGGISDISSTQSLFKNKKPLNMSLLEEKEKDLAENHEAKEYLTKVRGFSPEIIKQFRLGSEDKDWIVIPHIHEGQLWNYKSRNFKEKAFRRVFGQPSIPFNLDSLDKTKKTLVIVEGETDCIAATQLGLKNVLGLTTGAAAFPPEWIPYTLPYKDIYICLNSDVPGQNGALKLAEKLGMHKCFNVLLPTKDVNEYLLSGATTKEFAEVIKSAKRFDIKNISRIKDYVASMEEWMESDGALSGLSLPFPRVDAILNGFKEEDLIVLLGDTGVGKTTLTLNIIRHFISRGHRCLGFFLEGKIMYYILRMMSIESRKTKEELEELDKTTPEWIELKENFSEYPMYFYSGPQADLDPKKLTELLQVAVKMYDIEFVLIDNLQKFVTDDRDVVHTSSHTVSTLKKLATDLKIPILLISHIHNIDVNRKRIIMQDAKQTSTIKQEADIMLSIWNNKKKPEDEDDMKMTILKNRMGEGGFDIKFIFDMPIALYRERVEEVDGVAKTKKKTGKAAKKTELEIEDEETLDECFDV